MINFLKGDEGIDGVDVEGSGFGRDVVAGSVVSYNSPGVIPLGKVWGHVEIESVSDTTDGVEIIDLSSDAVANRGGKNDAIKIDIIVMQGCRRNGWWALPDEGLAGVFGDGVVVWGDEGGRVKGSANDRGSNCGRAGGVGIDGKNWVARDEEEKDKE